MSTDIPHTGSPHTGSTATPLGASPHRVTTAVDRPHPAEASTGELIKQVSEDLSQLVRSELRLAQVEISGKAKQAGVGLGAFGGAGVLALFGVGALIAAAILGLALVLPAWLAALIVGAVVLAIAGIAALIGKKKLSNAAPATPTRTIDSVKEDVREIKESIRS